MRDSSAQTGPERLATPDAVTSTCSSRYGWRMSDCVSVPICPGDNNNSLSQSVRYLTDFFC